MKKLFLMIFVLIGFVLSSFVFAGKADTAVIYTNAVSEWDYIAGDTVTTAYATLSGAEDTAILFSNFVPEKGWEYILTHAAFSGGSCDSLAMRLMVRGYDGAGNVICTASVANVDTNDCSGNAYLIPFGSGKLFGKEFDIFFQTFNDTDAGNQVIINRCQLWRRRPIQYRKMWK